MNDHTIKIINKSQLDCNGVLCTEKQILDMIERFNEKSRKEIIVGEITDYNEDIAFESVDVANASHRIYNLSLDENGDIIAKILTSPSREGRLLDSLLFKDEVEPYIRYYFGEDYIELNTINFQLK
jgi:hypothetical protein